MRIKINKKLCIKCGLCYFKEKNVFGIDDNGIAFVKKSEIKDNNKKIEKICKSCPTKAIEYK